MTAPLKENSFPSIGCHWELNVSSTWWMDFSAKIYFDQVSTPFCLTPWLSPFPPAFFFQVLPLLFCSICSCFSCLPVDKRDVLLDLQARALSHVFQSQWVSECVCTTLIPASVSQTARAEWLIGARQCDLRQGEHTQSYSSRSNSSAIIGALAWVMLFGWPCMRRQEELRAWFDTWIHLGLRCCYMLEEKRQTELEKIIERKSWKEYWQDLSWFRAVIFYKLKQCENCIRNIQNVWFLCRPQTRMVRRSLHSLPYSSHPPFPGLTFPSHLYKQQWL